MKRGSTGNLNERSIVGTTGLCRKGTFQGGWRGGSGNLEGAIGPKRGEVGCGGEVRWGSKGPLIRTIIGRAANVDQKGRTS